MKVFKSNFCLIALMTFEGGKGKYDVTVGKQDNEK